MNELKSCPFCGSADVYCWDTGTEYPAHSVVCPDCQAEGPEADSRENTIALWNTRQTGYYICSDPQECIAHYSGWDQPETPENRDPQSTENER